MLKSVKTAALMAFLAVPALAEQHEQVEVNEVVATVNGTEITLGHMIMIRASLPDQLRHLGGQATEELPQEQQLWRAVLGVWMLTLLDVYGRVHI